MFIARADVLLEQLGESEPELLAGLIELAEAWDTPRRGAAVDRIWPELDEDRDRLHGRRAGGGGRALAVIPGDFDWDDVGDFASIAKLHSGGRKTDLAILGENARVLADSSSGVVVSQSGRLISLIGVTRHRRRRHPGCAAGHDERERPAREVRRRRAASCRGRDDVLLDPPDVMPRARAPTQPVQERVIVM